MTWLTRAFGSPGSVALRPGQKRRKYRAARGRRILSLEVLEGRDLPSFIAPRDFDTGRGPTAVAVADINRDGVPDLITANNTAGTVSVLLGNGDGTFQPARDSAAGPAPIKVAVGDVNGDGIPDLVVTNYSYDTNTVRVLLGNGDGTFRAGQVVNVGQPKSGGLALVDVNGDGRLDIVMLDGGHIALFLGNGDGTFQPAHTLETGGFDPESLAVADLNGDAHPDLVIANRGDPRAGGANVSVLLGNGDGTFQPAQSYVDPGYAPWVIAVGDVTGDGVPDLIFGENQFRGFNRLGVLPGNGDGTFGSVITSPFLPLATSIAVGDLNGDGTPDLALTVQNGGGSDSPVHLLLGNGDGTFRDNGTVPGLAASAVAVADLYREGTLDLIAPDVIADHVAVLRGNGDGTFQAAPAYRVIGTLPNVVAVGDVNGDGIPDLVTVGTLRPGVGFVNVLLGNGDGTFQPAQSFSAGNAASVFVALGDFNGDGNLDIVTADTGGNTVSVYLGNGDGTFRSPQHFPAGPGPTFIQVSDLNRDGALDLVVTNAGSGTVSVLLGNGDGTFQAPRSYTVGSFPNSVGIYDFNGDGNLDLAVANGGSNTVSVLLGNGDGTFQPTRNYAAGPEPGSIGFADFDGDGVVDLAVVNSSHETVSVLRGNPDGSFQAPRSLSVPVGLGSLIAADFTGDGIPDLAVTDGSSVRLLVGNGDGTFRMPDFSYAGAGRYLETGDFNGDGFLDLVAARDPNSANVTVFLNAPDGGGSPHGTPAPGHKAHTAGKAHSEDTPALALAAPARPVEGLSPLAARETPLPNGGAEVSPWGGLVPASRKEDAPPAWLVRAHRTGTGWRFASGLPEPWLLDAVFAGVFS